MTAQQAEKESDAVFSELIDKIQKLSVADKLYILDYGRNIERQ